MAKPKPELLVRGVLLRDVAALKRRVQALEKALWPGETSRTPATRGHSRLVAGDQQTARRDAIEAFYRTNRIEWLRKHPRMLKRERAERTRLNKYLRDRGFEPEPDLDE